MEPFSQMKAKLRPFLPYGVVESWEDLNPRLYHAVHIYWLKFYGMWYNEFSPKNFLFWLQLFYTLVVLWLVCFLPGIGEVVYLLKRTENVGDIAEGLYLFLSEMYTYFKIAVFWMKREKIMNLLQYLHCKEFKPKQKEHREILLKSIKKARFIMTSYSTMCVGAVSVGIIMPLTENFDILPTNVEYPYFDVYKTPAYEAMYIHHVLSRSAEVTNVSQAIMSSTGVLTIFLVIFNAVITLYIYYKPATCIIDGVMDTILAAFIASAIGQIEILTFNLRNFMMLAERRSQRSIQANKSNGNSFRHHIRAVLKDCIVHHNTIIRYVSMIESAFSLASALQFMLSVMVLCLVGVQFLSIEEPSSHPTQMLWMAIYLTCMLIEVFILCWFGNELIWKSMGLRQAAFDGQWMDLDSKTAMYIVVFLERCNRPLCVTAGKIFTLSLDTYTNLINWSYKAFAVMRNTKK